VPEGAGWRIDGHKRWVTNGARSGLVFVFATTGGDENPTLGAFIVSPQSAGYAVTATETTMGLRASEIVSVELDGIQVPSDRVLGDSANGLEYALRALDRARLGIAAQSVGVAQGAFEHAIAYALDRHQFGHAIADFGAIQFKLADMAVQIFGGYGYMRDYPVEQIMRDAKGTEIYGGDERDHARGNGA
jgi:alkylation response protein AidB-like acyl-CoA dehydrogenase